MSTSSAKPAPKLVVEKVPFGGYYQRDVPAPDDDEIMRTGPGTPLGELFRRFWQPVCLSEQIKDLPLAIRIMSEDLVVFRDGEGRIGLLNRHCAHRGASLEYGIVEQRGLRCCYHGWHYDIDGTLLEAPGEPEHSPLPKRICQGAYPAFERDGLVFAYMGPPDKKPQFPVNESYVRPTNKPVPLSNYFPCNWLQVQENIPDVAHTALFHNGPGNASLRAKRATETAFPAPWAEMPVLLHYEVSGGKGTLLPAIRRLGDNVWVRMNYHSAPNHIDLGTLFNDGKSEFYFHRVCFNRWVVPHDDESSTIFGWRHFNDFEDVGKGDPSKLGVEAPTDFLGGQIGGRPYDIAQRDPGDWDVISSQRKMSRHSLENLGTTDAGVAMWRRVVRKAVRGESPGVLPAPMQPGQPLFSEPQRTYCQDSVMRIPPLPDKAADREMLRDIGKRVAEIMLAADEYPPGNERDAAIVRQLKALHQEYLKA